MTKGERIKQRRKELGLSVDELAEILGKDRATIYRYESNGIDNLPATVLEPLARALNTTPAYIMGWEEMQKNNDAIADIIIRLRTDKDFLELVLLLYNMDRDALSSLKSFLEKNNN